MTDELNFKPADSFKVWWDKNGRRLSGHSIYSKAAVIWNAAQPAQASAAPASKKGEQSNG